MEPTEDMEEYMSSFIWDFGDVSFPVAMQSTADTRNHALSPISQDSLLPGAPLYHLESSACLTFSMTVD